MSNTISFSIAIDSDRETVTASDTTSYVSPLRSAVAVYFSMAKVNSEGEETDLTITSNDDDPITDSEWSFSYSNGDGYYKGRYAAIPDYSSLTTYAIYDAVNSGGSVYRSKAGSNTNNSVNDTTWWEQIEDGASLADNKGESDESTNCDTLIYERTFTSNAQYWYGNVIAENCQCTDCSDDELLNKYVTFSILLNGAITADERTEPLTGEIISRRIESLYSDNC